VRADDDDMCSGANQHHGVSARPARAWQKQRAYEHQCTTRELEHKTDGKRCFRGAWLRRDEHCGHGDAPTAATDAGEDFGGHRQREQAREVRKGEAELRARAIEWRNLMSVNWPANRGARW
jgi:hypothetical protein